MPEKITKFLVPISIVLAGVIIAGAFIYLNQGKTDESASEDASLSQQMAEKAINFINENVLAEGNTASLLSVVEEGDIYKIKLKIGENEYDSYVTKDGKFLFPEAYNLEEEKTKEETPNDDNSSTEVPKQDKPDIKLFVMSYCPYGLQAQKMFLPVYNLLKDEADIGIYFVSYIMHDKQEIDENLRQYCIQKEEKEKYSDYLDCFVYSGETEKCLSETEINKTKLNSCISETDNQYNITSQYNNKDTWLSGRYPKFDVHSELNTKYGVQGSPAIVINEQTVSVSPRSPEKFKEVVCQSFNSLPEECSQTLSNDVPSPGIGGGKGSSSGGECK